MLDGAVIGLQRGECRLHGAERAQRIEAEIALDVLVRNARDGLQVDGADAIGKARDGGACGLDGGLECWRGR